MKKYRLSFIGRKAGALGVTYGHMITVEADSKEDAIKKLYETHEHIRALRIELAPEVKHAQDN